MRDIEPYFVVFEGLILIAVGLPMYLRRIPPNRLYGFRVAATLNNPRRWYWANRRAGGRLVLTGVAAMLGGWVASLVGVSSVLVSATVTTLGAIAMGVLGWIEIRRDVAQTHDREGE